MPYLIKQGATFQATFRLETQEFVFAGITGVVNSAPCVITAPSHGITGALPWRILIQGVKGMKAINDKKFIDVLAIDSDTLEVPWLDTSDTAVYKPYTSGGTVKYARPVDLTNATARMQIRPSVSSTDVLLELTTENGGILLTPDAGRLDLTIDAITTAAITWKKAVFDIELVIGAQVRRIIQDTITVSKEVTRDE